MQNSIYHNLVWDYQISKQDFISILAGKKSIGNLNQAWAIARVLENASYYQAIQLVSPTTIKKNWSKVKPKIFNPTIKHGYEYILHHPTLSITG